MWVTPYLENSIPKKNIGNWKSFQQSLQFILQESIDIAELEYRIITRSRPVNIIASSKNIEGLKECFKFLHEDFLENNPVRNPKELLKNIKAMWQNFPDYSHVTNKVSDLVQADNKLETDNEKTCTETDTEEETNDDESDTDIEDKDKNKSDAVDMPVDFLTDETSGFLQKKHDTNTASCTTPATITNPSQQNQPNSQSELISKSKEISQNLPSNSNLTRSISVKLNSANKTVPSNSKNKTSLAREDSTQLGSNKPIIPKSNKVKQVAANLNSNISTAIANVNNVSNIPAVFQEDYLSSVKLPHKLNLILGYPSKYLDDGVTKKPQLQFLKEVQEINLCRKIIVGLTIYSLFLRFCSIDLFFLLLIVSNCLALYFFKNPSKLNLAISKLSPKNKDTAKVWTPFGSIDSLFKAFDAPGNNAIPATNTSAPLTLGNDNTSKTTKRASLFFGKTLNFNNSAISEATTNTSNLSSFLPTNRLNNTFNGLKSAKLTSPDILVSSPTKMEDTTPKVKNETKANTRKLRTLSLIFPS